MANIADLRPGAAIYNINDSRGTLTCFAIKLQKPQRLYGVTARHVAPDGTWIQFGDRADLHRLLIGGPVKSAPAIDISYFKIDDAYKRQLVQQNFFPLGRGAEPGGVWDPGNLRQKVAGAINVTHEEQLKAKLMPVEHFGNVTGPGIAGSVKKYAMGATATIQATHIVRGDSGGPVIDSKHRWVGFVSSGLDAQASTGGTIVLLHDGFAALGLSIATWANRQHWQ